jgi:hypothetical protein
LSPFLQGSCQNLELRQSVAGVSVHSRHLARNAGFLRPYFASRLGISRWQRAKLRQNKQARRGGFSKTVWLQPRFLTRSNVQANGALTNRCIFQALTPGWSSSDIAVSLRLLRAFDDMVLAGASRKEIQSLIGRTRRVVAGCELNLDKDDVLPLRRRLARLEGRLQTQLRAE